MILLEFHNRIVAETLTSRFEAFTETGKAPAVDITIADFDGVLFHLASGEDKTKITVSIGLKFYHELQQYGVDDLMKRVYGDRVVEPESGYDCSVLVDLETLGADAAAVIDQVARMRRNCFAAVFEYFFKKYEAKDTSGEAAMIHYRDQETMYVSAHKDRVTVVFSTLFSDADDIIIGKVFLQVRALLYPRLAPLFHFPSRWSLAVVLGCGSWLWSLAVVLAPGGGRPYPDHRLSTAAHRKQQTLCCSAAGDTILATVVAHHRVPPPLVRGCRSSRRADAATSRHRR